MMQIHFVFHHISSLACFVTPYSILSYSEIVFVTQKLSFKPRNQRSFADFTPFLWPSYGLAERSWRAKNAGSLGVRVRLMVCIMVGHS